jgi:acetyl esterase
MKERSLLLDLQARNALLATSGPPVSTLTLSDARAAVNKYRPMICSSEIAGAHRSHVGGAPVPITELVPADTEPWGTVVYFHGGGWTVGSPELLEGSCLMFAREAGVRIMAVRYRLAPEHAFPAAIEDCLRATRWILERDGGPVAVMGESAGGNLAAATSATVVANGGRDLTAQILMNPALDPLMKSDSYSHVSDAFGLSRADMTWFWSNYLSRESDRYDPRAAPLLADTAGLPATYVLTSGFDPLQGEGLAYVERLRDGGIAVCHDHRRSLPHDVFWTTGAVLEARAAVVAAARWLRRQRPA